MVTLVLTAIRPTKTHQLVQLFIRRDNEDWVGQLKEPSALLTDLEAAGIFDSPHDVLKKPCAEG